MKKYITISDGGCLCIGNEIYQTLIYNNMGDGKNDVWVVKNYREFADFLLTQYHNRTPELCGFKDVATIKGKFNLYNYDCLDVKELSDEVNICTKLEGRYIVYLRSEMWVNPIFVIVKL